MHTVSVVRLVWLSLYITRLLSHPAVIHLIHCHRPPVNVFTGTARIRTGQSLIMTVRTSWVGLV
jgi:hypothetical protein